MSPIKNAYKKNFDQKTYKKLQPAKSGLYADINGVYLTGFLYFEGNEEWALIESGSASTNGVFKYSACKDLFSQADVCYSHRAMINDETQWGMACYYVRLNHVDPKTFKYIKPIQKVKKYQSDGFYFRDKNHTYYLSDDQDSMFRMQSRSPATLIVQDVFAHDDKHAYFKGRKITKSDGASFRKLDGRYRYEDNNFIYENDNWTRVKITTK